MINGKKNVLEASKGVTLRMQYGKENYKNPIIPEGYVHLKGMWNTGFVIQNQTDKSEFVWIPVGCLNNDGTLDGKNFDEKFGRRKFDDSVFSKREYNEEVNQDFVQSVKKYGGYYFSRYHASKEEEKPVFKRNNMPWNNIQYYEAETVGLNYAKDNKDIKSCITNGAAFDSMLSWIIKSGAKKREDLVKDSTLCGNYWNYPNSSQELMSTGSNEEWCILNIYDIAGNVAEWTSEMYGTYFRVLRGGVFYDDGYESPATKREGINPSYYYISTSFRIVLYLK